jgi:hypothetical protein
MLKNLSEKTQLIALITLTTLTRLPFIFDGYGVEEDSWGLVVNAFEMKQKGHYVASRFPGHPFQEYVYRLIYDQPAWVYNIFSLLMSVIAVGFFFRALKKIQLNGAFTASLMFCFTPVFFIAGTYTIDFAWTIAFVMASFYFLLDRKFILSGIMLGMATGCRLTSEVFLIPWAIILWNTMDKKAMFKDFLKVAVPAAIIGGLWFLPAYLNYGRTFFDYSDQFPYPPLTKVIYKATIGVFGFIGMIALIIFGFYALLSWRKKTLNAVTLFSSERLLLVCFTVIVLHVIAYLRLPQKSGYLVPLIPFAIIFLAVGLNEKRMRIATVLFIIAPFLFSINLTDNLRGSKSSSLALKMKISGQEIFLDPLSGPVFSERSKRINKMKYCSDVIDITKNMDYRKLIISGWWYNEIQVYYLQNLQHLNSHFRFYETCKFLDSAKANSTSIFYLPEQNIYNDEMFGQNCTDSIAEPFPEK